MGKRYLMDSNALIDYIALRLPQSGSDFVEKIFDNDFLTSIIVKIEVLGYNDVPHKMAAMEEFISAATIFPLDEAVAQKTIELRRLHRKFKLGDAIIAATALVHNFTLISRNLSDFKHIRGLDVIDPYAI
jgi:predicted nucleic acid-binding protein